MEPILRVQNLTKQFKDFTAVDDVSFDLMPDECLGIIGESGSGKTTLVNMVTRLIDPTAGHITLCGADITHSKGKALRETHRAMQMVFQTPTESFDARRTLGDGISESLRNFGMPKRSAAREAERLLTLCGLDPAFAKRYPHEVSGGQCQRAAIARAIAIRPKLLICDEATSALDVTIQKEIINLLARLKTELSMSYLFVSHDIALVQQFCDRVVVMHHGRIVEQGRPDDIIRDPKDAYTKQLIDSIL